MKLKYGPELKDILFDDIQWPKELLDINIETIVGVKDDFLFFDTTITITVEEA